MLVAGLRVWEPGVSHSAASLVHPALQTLGSALAVALLEETLLRGAMFSGIAREAGVKAAMLLTALVYAATHFIARYRIPAELVVPSSGFAIVTGSLQAFSDPLAILDAFVALFAVGILLGAVQRGDQSHRRVHGSLHAGWVWVMLLVRQTSARPSRTPAWGFYRAASMASSAGSCSPGRS